MRTLCILLLCLVVLYISVCDGRSRKKKKSRVRNLNRAAQFGNAEVNELVGQVDEAKKRGRSRRNRKGNSFKSLKAKRDRNGNKFASLQQEFNGIPVLGGEVNEIVIAAREFQPTDKATGKPRGKRIKVKAERRISGVIIDGLEEAVGSVSSESLQGGKKKAKAAVIRRARAQRRARKGAKSRTPKGGRKSKGRTAKQRRNTKGRTAKGRRNSKGRTAKGRRAARGVVPDRWLPQQVADPVVYGVEPVIYVDPQTHETTAGYLVQSADDSPDDPHLWHTIVDADDNVIAIWDNLQSNARRKRAIVAGTGPGGNEKTGQYNYGTGDKPNLNVDQVDATKCVFKTAKVQVTHLHNGVDDTIVDPFSFTCLDHASDPVNGAFSPINDAHYFGEQTVSMFQNWYNEDPVTLPLNMKVHYGINYQNAYFSPRINGMVFGDGGNVFHPLTSLDVVAHEVAHAVTARSSNLLYLGQSGGLNEAFSDMAGKTAEQFAAHPWSAPSAAFKASFNWGIGYDIFKTGFVQTALRYMDDPPKDGVSIDHVGDFFYEEPCYINGEPTGTCLDVHYSSGVFNKVFTILAGKYWYGLWDAFDIFFVANTRGYWGRLTNFEEAAEGTLRAAEDIANGLHFGYYYGHLYLQEVVDAFNVVGLSCSKASGEWNCVSQP